MQDAAERGIQEYDNNGGGETDDLHVGKGHDARDRGRRGVSDSMSGANGSRHGRGRSSPFEDLIELDEERLFERQHGSVR